MKVSRFCTPSFCGMTLHLVTPLLIAVCFFAFSGCAPPAPIFTPVEVDVPVGAPCDAAPVAPPDFALSHAGANDDLFAKTKSALIELDQRKAYEAELQSRLSLCR